jgi:hypothetical protein
MNRPRQLFFSVFLLGSVFFPHVSFGQSDVLFERDHNLKLNLAPLITPMLNYPIPSVHYEHQIAAKQSFQVGVYLFGFNFWGDTWHLGSNVNYRYYFSKTQRLKGIYLGGGFNFNFDLDAVEEIPPLSFRPAIGFQDFNKRWVYNFGFGLNMRLFDKDHIFLLPHVMVGVGYCFWQSEKR